MTATSRNWAADLLHCWFHTLRPRDWFRPAPWVDEMLRRRYSGTLAAMRTRPAHEFLDDGHTALAAVLLFDQIPRNLYRDTARAFATDPLAREITHAALRRGWDRRLTPAQRQFLAMPLMHSEKIADQNASLSVFGRLGPRYGWSFARSHYRMIARFGRFPHRNAVLDRNSTMAEKRAVAAGFDW